MENRSIQQKLKRLVLQRNALLVPLIALSIATIFLTHAIQAKKERIVVLPTKGETLWLEKTNCSKSYLETFGLYMTSLLFTKDLASAPLKMDEALSYAHPSKRKALQQMLEEEFLQMKQDQTSFSFETKKYFADANSKTFALEGTQKTYYPKGESSEVKEKNLRYHLEFKMEEGQLKLQKIKKEDL